jgi:two-component system KDP operon response regulator KdpE
MLVENERAVQSESTARPVPMEGSARRGNVLVIEDEPGLRRLLRFCLEREGYEVRESQNGEEGLDAIGQQMPDAVLLDMSLPDTDGLAVLKRLREWTQVPVLVLSERGEEAEKIMVLDSGANDYVTKPFSTGELLARLRVTQRYAKTPAQQTKVFRSGDLVVDLASRTVRVKGKRAKLTPTEYSLLRLFVQNAGKVLTHRQIFREVWGPAENDKIGYIRVYLTSLRNKLARELIVTEPGIGYRLVLSPND